VSGPGDGRVDQTPQPRLAEAEEGPARGPKADVWVLPAADMPRWAAAGDLEPIPWDLVSPETSYDWKDLLPIQKARVKFVRDSGEQGPNKKPDKEEEWPILLVWNRVAYALPLIGDAPVCCYRTDWLSNHIPKKVVEKVDPREGPKTWDDYERIAASAKPSLPPLPSDDAELEREFYMIASTYARQAVPEGAGSSENDLAFHYDLSTGKPRIDSPGFVEALKLLQRLQAHRAAGGQPVEAFRKGEAALCLVQAWQLPALQDRGSLVKDRFGICGVPGTGPRIATRGDANVVPYLGSATWVGVVPRQPSSRDAAFALLADLSGRETSGQIVLDVQPGSRWAGGVVRLKQLTDSWRWDAFDLDKQRTGDLKKHLQETLVHPRLRNPVLCLRIPGQKERQKALVQGLRQALTGGGDAQKTLTHVAQEWTALDEKAGKQKTMHDYRISIGLEGP
jgi:ABC-type glycerol-3-phosphate transport system substrate-binding protein